MTLPNRPLQQPNATPARSHVGLCRDAAGCARGSSRPWYDRKRPWRSLLNGRSLGRRAMAWTERERDPESFSKVLSVFEGERYALDLGSSKVLRFMLERPEGCDATLSADRFEIRFGWHPSRHRYYLSAAPAVVSRILELAGAPPNTQQVRGVIGPATLPQWSFGRRRVWLRVNQDAITIQVRAAEGDDIGAITEPAAFPDPIECSRQFLEFPSPLPCPHCATLAASYRQLHGGSLVCGSCGRSFELSDL